MHYICYYNNRNKENKIFTKSHSRECQDVFEIVEKIPESFYVWNIGDNMGADEWLPLAQDLKLKNKEDYRSFYQWRTAILSAFGYDPLKCECGTTMLFLELYFHHKRVSLEEMYENVMFRSRGRRSFA